MSTEPTQDIDAYDAAMTYVLRTIGQPFSALNLPNGINVSASGAMLWFSASEHRSLTLERVVSPGGRARVFMSRHAADFHSAYVDFGDPRSITGRALLTASAIAAKHFDEGKIKNVCYARRDVAYTNLGHGNFDEEELWEATQPGPYFLHMHTWTAKGWAVRELPLVGDFDASFRGVPEVLGNYIDGN